MKKRGRKPLLNDERKKRILDALELGATYEIAAEAGGITRSTLFRYLKRGETEKTGQFATFYDEFKRSEALNALNCLKTINVESRNGNYKCAQWLLERRHNYLRGNHHERRSSSVEEEPNQDPQTFRDILIQQRDDLRAASKKASSAESWQAFTALQKQLISITMQIVEYDKANEDELFDKKTDQEIIEEVVNMVLSMPPQLKQTLVHAISSLSNVTMLKR